MMQCSRKLKVTDLNPHLICVLCGGYFVDATTIIECLHSFCRSCIVRYLETNKYCPICDVQVHKTRPLQNIRPDDTLQTIVYKLVPGLYQDEMRCRREFYAKSPEARLAAATVSPEARGELTDQSRIILPDESISLCLEYIGASNLQAGQGSWGRRYLRCPAAVSVFHLHKLIRAKFGLAMGHRVDVFYKDDLLPDNWTLMDVAYIYQWKRKSPIHLTYRILESQRKRIKLSHDSPLPVEASKSAGTEPAVNSSGSGSFEPADVADVSPNPVAATLSTDLPGSNVAAPVTVTAPCTSGLQSSAVTTTISVDVTASSASGAGTPKSDVATPVSTSTSTKTFPSIPNKEPPIEWKEVQLQISENGIMSVAGVENDRLLTALKPISVSSEDSADVLTGKSSDKNKSTGDEKSENKVPLDDSDPNLSALHDKDIVNTKSESRTKPVDTPTNNNLKFDNKSNNSAVLLNNNNSNSSINSSSNSVSNNSNNDVSVVSKPEDIRKDGDSKMVNKDGVANLDGVKNNNKPVSYKLPSVSDKSNAIFKSKTDKLEDTVRNISNRSEPSHNSLKQPVHTPSPPAQVKDDGVNKPRVYSSENPDVGNVNRLVASSPKVYPGVKPISNSPVVKDDHTKINNVKVEPPMMPVKQTPMEILNSHKKVQNHTVKYKTLKTPIKPWNPSIPRSAALSMKHSQPASSQSKDGSGSDNPTPPKQPRFFKLRNMPRFLGNPASGVKPMYQVAPGSEIISRTDQGSSVTSSSNSSPSNLATGISSTAANITGSTAILTNTHSNSISTASVSSVGSSTSSTTTAAAATIIATTASTMMMPGMVNSTSAFSIAPQKHSKQNSVSGITLMKIDPKTLSPITVTPHVINNPPRSTSSPQPKKLPPPFTPGSTKHSNHFTNCRTAHSSSNGSKSSVPRIPSPAHTGGLIPTNPFLPSVAHSNPHLLYSAFANPFSATDPVTGNRLLTGPANSELIRAMSALCSSGSAFHPSLPPSISMLFNPHHAHHRTMQPERSNFKCASTEKQSTQSPPPAVQRIPPSNSSSKSHNDTDIQQMNSVNCLEQIPNSSSCSSRLKKSKVDMILSSTTSVMNPKQAQTNSLKKSPTESIKHQTQKYNLKSINTTDVTTSQSINKAVSCNDVKETNTASSTEPSKPKPSEKKENISNPSSTNNKLSDMKLDNGNTARKPSDSGTSNTNSNNTINNLSCNSNENSDKKEQTNKECETKSNSNEVKNTNELKSKDEHNNIIIPNNNNNNNNPNKTRHIVNDDCNSSTVAVSEST